MEDCFSDSDMLDAASEASYSTPASPLSRPGEHTSLDISSKRGVPTAPSVHADTGGNNGARSQTSSERIGCQSPATAPKMIPHSDRVQEPTVGPKIGLASKSSVLAKIEAIFESMADVLLNERGQLSLNLMTRPTNQKHRFDSNDTATAPTESVQHICFPGKSEREAWRFGKPGVPLRRVCPLT